MYSRIIGMGAYLPEKILTNQDLEKIVDTNNEWIVERSGIHSRHILSNNETLSDIIENAANQAINNAGIDKKQIDLIIVATLTPEYITPSAACILQQRLGISDCPAFDINAACTGFIYGLDIANTYIKSGAAKCVLLVAGEGLTKITDWTDRTTCVLFGDGAGAAILKADSIPGIKSIHLHADGRHVDLLCAKNSIYSGEPAYIKMRGNELFKLAVNKLSDVAKEALSHNNIDSNEITWLVPHQANLRIISAVAEKLHISMDKVILTIDHHGNTSAASIPLAISEGINKGLIKKGDTLLLQAFGAGLTWGSALINL